ncbi:hypothetical protein [Enterococcus mundtii]|uniref:hypothetical protein n=1 Tax=Enterococcus mundtii TaxID=53346 RepID=UPI001929B269|nr:hypothetical protein [Enterococcus mundtii]NBA63604.1 hypothetical protein [Enterococcus mundtii]
MKINKISRIVGKLLLIMVLLLPQLPFQLTYADYQSSSSDNHEVTAKVKRLEEISQAQNISSRESAFSVGGTPKGSGAWS